MSEVSDFVSVQPENRTVIEEALEYAWDRLIARQNDPYPLLKQPLSTREDFVALLAGERGVFDWQPDDTLAQQRQTAEQAFAIHRLAGTREGLRLALDVIDATLEVEPWYAVEGAPGPYYIQCIAWREREPVTKALSERILSRINHVKAKRDSVELYIAFALDSTLALAGAVHRAIVVDDADSQGLMPPLPSPRGTLGLAGAVHGLATHENAASGRLPQLTDCIGSLCMKGGVYQVTIQDDAPLTQPPPLLNGTFRVSLGLGAGIRMTVITELEPTAI